MPPQATSILTARAADHNPSLSNFFQMTFASRFSLKSTFPKIILSLATLGSLLCQALADRTEGLPKRFLHKQSHVLLIF